MMEKRIGISETMVSANRKSSYLRKLEVYKRNKIIGRVKKTKKLGQVPFPLARASVRKHR